MTGINAEGNQQVGHIEPADNYRRAQAVSQSPKRPKDVPTWSDFMRRATVEYNKLYGKHIDAELLKAFEARDAEKEAEAAKKEQAKLEEKLRKLTERVNKGKTATSAAA